MFGLIDSVDSATDSSLSVAVTFKVFRHLLNPKKSVENDSKVMTDYLADCHSME